LHLVARDNYRRTSRSILDTATHLLEARRV